MLPPIGPLPVVAGYAVSHLIGHGATSTVWAATDDDTGEAVAVKITDPAMDRAADVLAIAARESAVLERVPHDHVIRLRRAFARPDGSVAIVMDRAEGGSLADLVAARGRLTDGEVATVLTPLAGVLAALHRAGVVHGDLSPRNVLFTAAGKPLLADFATARAVGEGDAPLPAGTPGFLPPERAAGDVATEAGDVYGLGALAWFALTGRPLSPGAAPDPAHAAGLVGAAYGPVVTALLDADPDARPDPAQAAQRLYAAAPPVPLRLVPPGEGDITVALTRRLRAQAALAPAGPAERPPRRWGRRSRGRHAAPAPRGAAGSRGRLPAGGVGLGLVGVVVVAVAVSTVAWVRGTDGSGPDPVDPALVEITEHAEGALGGLVAQRARALQEADPAGLLRAEALGSPIHEHDGRLVAALLSTGRRYAAVRYTIRTVRPVEVHPPTATLLAQIDTLAYDAAAPTEAVAAVTPTPGAPVLVEVRLVDGRWLLADVREP